MQSLWVLQCVSRMNEVGLRKLTSPTRWPPAPLFSTHSKVSRRRGTI